MIVSIISAVAAVESSSTSKEANELQIKANGIAERAVRLQTVANGIAKKAVQLQTKANDIADRQADFQEWVQYKTYWDYCNTRVVSWSSVAF